MLGKRDEVRRNRERGGRGEAVVRGERSVVKEEKLRNKN